MIIIQPRPRPRYSLADLVAQCDFETALSPEEIAWLEDRPQGNEAL